MRRSLIRHRAHRRRHWSDRAQKRMRQITPRPAGGARDPGGNNEEQSTTARRIDHDKEPTPWVLKSPNDPP